MKIIHSKEREREREGGGEREIEQANTLALCKSRLWILFAASERRQPIIGAISSIEFGSRNYIGRFIVVRLWEREKKRKRNKRERERERETEKANWKAEMNSRRVNERRYSLSPRELSVKWKI